MGGSLGKGVNKVIISRYTHCSKINNITWDIFKPVIWLKLTGFMFDQIYIMYRHFPYFYTITWPGSSHLDTHTGTYLLVQLTVEI